MSIMSLRHMNADMRCDNDVPNAELNDSVDTQRWARTDAVTLKQQRRVREVKLTCQTHVLPSHVCVSQ